jgi:mycothiol synthase
MRVRAPRRDEAAAVLDVIVARDVADIGRADYTLSDVLGDWEHPDCDRERDAFVVDDGGLVGWAHVDRRVARVAVRPGCEGRGIGTLLRRAVEARQLERAVAQRQSIASSNSAGTAHLRAAGYACTGFEQRMRVELDAVPALPAASARVRRFDLDVEGDAVFALISAAFREIDGTVQQAFDAWHAEIAAISTPALRLALDDDEGLAGATIGERWEDGVGFVSRLAVAKRARGRGHGRTLLLAMFDAFGAQGLHVAQLGVAGTNANAARLYESVGMVVDFRAEVWERRPCQQPLRQKTSMPATLG